MGLTEQKIRRLEKSTAKAHLSFALGLGTFAFLVEKLFDSSWWKIPVSLGIILLLSSLYLAFIHKWKRKEYLNVATKIRIDYVALFLGFTSLGVSFTYTNIKWMFWVGILCICIACIILGVGVALEMQRGLEGVGRRKII